MKFLGETMKQAVINFAKANIHSLKHLIQTISVFCLESSLNLQTQNLFRAISQKITENI